MWNIGFLIATSVDLWKPFTDAFEAQLKSHLKTGDDFKIEYRAAGGLQKLYTKDRERFFQPQKDIFRLISSLPGELGPSSPARRQLRRFRLSLRRQETQLTPGW